VAMACFRFVTLPPSATFPVRKFPFVFLCIALLTDLSAVLPYLAIASSYYATICRSASVSQLPLTIPRYVRQSKPKRQRVCSVTEIYALPVLTEIRTRTLRLRTLSLGRSSFRFAAPALTREIPLGAAVGHVEP
jgi:hypothetical protein